MTNLRDLNIVAPRSDFGELVTVQRTPLIELKSAVDAVSSIRNVTTTAGSGAVAIENSEYKLTTTALAADSAQIDSAERGRYLPGYGALCGIGIRMPVGQTFAGTSYAEWGYHNATDGYGWGVDATGIYVWIDRNGSQTKTYQSAWNQDKLDGTAGTAFNLSLADGNIFEIQFSWYGFGSIQFYVVKTINSGGNTPIQQRYLVHVIVPSQQTSIEQPNCPISVVLDNGNSAVARTVFVAGRTFNILGGYYPTLRITGAWRTGLGSIGTTWVPVISFRRKTSSKFLAQSVKLNNLDAIADSRLLVGFVHDGVLTGASWGAPQQKASETVLEADTSATAITVDANTIFVGGIHVISGANKDSLNNEIKDFTFDLVEDKPLTMVVRRDSGTNATLNLASLNLTEEW